MKSKIEVLPDYDLVAIAASAGATEGKQYVGGELHVEGVTQESLDAALASYDHSATLAKRVTLGEESDIVRGLAKIVIALVDRVESGEPLVMSDIPAEFRSQVVNAVQRRRT